MEKREDKVTDKFVRNIVERLAARSVHPSAIGDGATAGQVLTLGTDLIAEWVSPTSGVTDHGLLTGLADDDHPQYHNDSRGDARYWPLSTDLATQVELDAHINDTTDAHDASAISIVDAGGYYTSTDVEGALQEAATTGGASDLDDLSDVTIGTPATGEVIRYNGAQWVDATLVPGDVSGFDTQVRTSRLNQMTVPNAAVPMGTNKLTGLAAGSANGDSLRYEQLFTTGTVSLLGKLSMPDTLNLESSGRQSILAGGNLYLYAATGDTYAASRLGQAFLELGAGGGTPADWSMSRTAANEATIAAGDVLKLDTAAEADNSTKAATTAYVDRATGNASTVRPAVEVAKSTPQSLANTTDTVITFDLEAYDTDSMHSTVTNTSRLVAPSTGTYLVSGALSFSPNATGARYCQIKKNGTGYTYPVALVNASAAVSSVLPFNQMMQLNAGDYVEIQGWQSSGGALNVDTYTRFALTWVGGTGAAWGNAGAGVTNSVAQSIPNAAWTAVTWNTETVDIDGMHSTSSATDRLTCVTPGTYTFTGTAAFATNGTGFRAFRIMKNGGTVIGYGSVGATSLDATAMSVASYPVPMIAGDYVSFEVYQSSGGALNTSPTVMGFGGVREGYQTNPADLPGTYHAALYMANSGAPTHTSNGGWQLLHAGGGTDAWVAEWDKRPSGVTAQVDATAGVAVITIRKTGVYRVQSCINFSAITSGKVVGGGPAINGAVSPAAYDVRTMGATEQVTLRTDDLMLLTAGDYLQLMAYQNDSASEAYNVGGGKYANRLTVEYIGQST